MKDWIKIYTAEKKYKSELIMGMLEENGIECEEISTRDSSFLIGTIDIYVHPDDEHKALELIKSHKD